MMTKRTRNILILSLVFFFGSVCLCAGLWYVITSEGKELSSQAAALAEFRAEEQAVGALARLVDDTVTERTELQGYILHKDNVPAFITELEGFAAEQGVTLRTSSLREEEAEGFSELVISLEVEGSRKALVHLYQMFETLPYHSYVSSVSMSRALDNATGATSWQSDIELTVSLTGL